MPNITPFTNFHELNLDWILQKMKELETKVDNIVGGSTPSVTTPLMDGVGDPGSSISYSRGDHVHPSDTSRASTSALAAVDTKVDDNYRDLNAAINDVDAKIAFTSAAPLMDGVASSGSSYYQARSDHVHPTDTSRASQTQVDTIQAVVDQWAGSASPYAGTPAMDGVGSPGNVDAYARGNHVHPSDTSKLDTAGGEITGDLIVDSLTVFKDTAATGWLRVGNVPQVPGTSIRIIVVKGNGGSNPAEVHDVIMTILRSSVKFNMNYNDGDSLHVNKIRYTSAGKLDIHVDSATATYIGVFMEKAAPTKTDLQAISLTAPEWVADAPDGETIVRDNTFLQRSSTNREVTEYGKTWTFWKREDVASMTSTGNVGEALAAGSHAIDTLQAGWRPYKDMDFPIAIGPSDAHIHITASSGVVTLENATAFAADDPCSVAITWACQ